MSRPRERSPQRYKSVLALRLPASLAAEVDTCAERLGISAAAILRSALLAAQAKPSAIEGLDELNAPADTQMSFRLDEAGARAIEAISKGNARAAVRQVLLLATRHIRDSGYRVIWPLEF